MFYEAWRKEKENSELQRLDKDFYVQLSEHVRTHIEALQMLDENSLGARLATEENIRIAKLFKDLIWTRQRKIFESAFKEIRLSSDRLTSEEEVIYSDLLLTLEKTKIIENNTLRGREPTIKKTVEKSKKTLLIRFLQAIPAIVGPNTKVYGPFKVEDVAALPFENAENLIKRGIALKVDFE